MSMLESTVSGYGAPQKQAGSREVRLQVHQHVRDFWKRYRADGTPPLDVVRTLARVANDRDPARAGHGIAALFGEVIEPLCDAFSAKYCRAYDRVFSEVIQTCRHDPACAALNQELMRAGLRSAADLCRRRARLAQDTSRWQQKREQRIRKVIVLSRVTIGADIAITTVALNRAQQLFPEAELVLMGPGTAHAIIAGHERMRYRAVSYERRGHLAARLNAWVAVLEGVREELEGLKPSEYVIIDPDSRLTQLGLLPLAEDERYAFFHSRSYECPGRQKLGELASSWMNETFGGVEETYPRIWLSNADRNWGNALCSHLRSRRRRPIVSVSFGVGGNEQKRLGETFEQELIRRLVKADSLVVLTRGAGQDEVTRTYALSEKLSAGEIKVCHLERGQATCDADDAQVVTWEASLGEFFGAIGASDAYVGYDSCGQHVAAAMNVPTLTVFRKTAGERHLARWSPHGAGRIAVLDADADAGDARNLERAMMCYRQLIRGGY